MIRKVRDWLPDWLLLHSSEESQRSAGVLNLLDCEVESAQEARELVNLRLDNMILWLDGLRPADPPKGLEG